MARAFNLTAEINLRGPANIRTVVADIRRQLGSVDVNINPRLNPASIRNINTMNTALRALNGTLAVTTTNAQSVSTALRNLGQSFNNVIGRNTQQGLGTAAQNINNVGNAAGRATTQMQEFGRQSALAVRRFAAFTVVTSSIYAFTGALRKGVTDFIAFDKEFVRLQQVTGESAKSLQSLAKVITDLSVGLGVGSQELTTVAVTLAQAGLSAADTRKSLKALALSALAPSFDDMNQTVEGSIALMRQFGISAGDLEGALGSINAVAAKFAVEASDIITAIQRTGGVFATASRGVSEGTDALNEFVAVFTSVRATTRESAETIATGLRTIFTRIQRSETIQALEQFGVTLTDLEGKFVGPYEAVRRLSEGLSKLDPRDLQFSQIVEELGGFRQIGKVIPLIQQFAVAQDALKTAQTGQASLAKDAATAQLSIANQIAKVREEFTALIRSIGESESFRSFISLSLQLASGLIKLADAAKIVLPALTALATIRGLSALTQFGAGFAGAFGAAGGARGLGQRLGGGRRFATGGLVPGSGNRDTVSAMLTPGEFVIRKKAVESIGVNNLRHMNKYAGGGLVRKASVGFAIMNSSLSGGDESILSADQVLASAPPSAKDQVKNILETRKNKPYYVVRQGLSKNTRAQFNKAIDNGLVAGVNKTVKSLAVQGGPFSGLPVPSVTKSSASKFLSGVNPAARGALFEEILSSMRNKGVYTDNDPNRPFDFPAGLGAASKVFDRLSFIQYVDAKASTAKAKIAGGKGSMSSKIASQLLLEGAGTIKGIKGKAKATKLSKPQVLSGLLSKYGIPSALGSITDPGTRNLVETTLRDGRIPSRSGALDKLRALLSPAVRKARGGSISGEDSVPSLLTPGEFVINKRAAKKIGSARLHTLNRADKISGFNKGGSVGGIQTFSGGGGVQRFLAGGGVMAFRFFEKIGTTLLSLIPKIQSGFNSLTTSVKGLSGTVQNVSSRFTSLGRNVQQTGLLPSGGAGRRLMREAREARAEGYTGQAFKERMRANRGGMGGMGGFIALTAGGAAVEGASSFFGGESKSAGRAISSMGGDALNYGAIGATVGSLIAPILGPFAPFGTAIGAATGGLIGLVTGFAKTYKAADEFAEKTRQIKVQDIGEKLNSAIDRWSKENVPLNDIISKNFMSLQTAEAGSLKGNNLQQPIGDIISQNKTAAEAAIKIVETEMMRTGKTFAEVSSSFDPELFKQLQLAIVETNAEYIQTVVDLSKATDPGTQEDIKKKQAELLKSFGALTFAAKDLEIIEKQRAAEAAKIVKEIDKTLDIYRRANAYADKYSAALERLVKATENRVNYLSASPKVQNVDRQNEEVLGNISAFSFGEVRAAAGSVAGLAGGSPEAKALADQAVASKILADQLPALIKSTNVEKRNSIVGNLTKLFEAENINIKSPEIDKVLTEIGDRLTKATSDTDTEKLTKELEDTVIGELSRTAEEGAKLLGNLAKKYNDTVQTGIDLQNQYNEAIAKSNEYTRKAGVIRINAELDLAKALGNSPTLQQLNEPFDFEIRDLTRGLRDVGGLRGNQATDPAAIGSAILRLGRQNVDLEKAVKEGLKQGAGLGADQAGNAGRAQIAAETLKNINLLGKNNLALEEGRTALEKLANDGSKAANALAKIQEEQQKVEGFGNFLEKVFTSSFDELFQMNREASAFVAAQTQGPGFMRSPENRQLAFAGLNAKKDLYSKEEFANLRADLFEKSLAASGFQGKDFVGQLGMTVEEALNRIKGRISEEDPNVKAYRAAVKEQITANKALALINKQQALIIQESMIDLQIFLASKFPDILTQALRDARADAAAAAPKPPAAPAQAPGVEPNKEVEKAKNALATKQQEVEDLREARNTAKKTRDRATSVRKSEEKGWFSTGAGIATARALEKSAISEFNKVDKALQEAESALTDIEKVAKAVEAKAVVATTQVLSSAPGGVIPAPPPPGQPAVQPQIQAAQGKVLEDLMLQKAQIQAARELNQVDLKDLEAQIEQPQATDKVVQGVAAQAAVNAPISRRMTAATQIDPNKRINIARQQLRQLTKNKPQVAINENSIVAGKDLEIAQATKNVPEIKQFYESNVRSLQDKFDAAYSALSENETSAEAQTNYDEANKKLIAAQRELGKMVSMKGGVKSRGLYGFKEAGITASRFLRTDAFEEDIQAGTQAMAPINAARAELQAAIQAKPQTSYEKMMAGRRQQYQSEKLARRQAAASRYRPEVARKLFPDLYNNQTPAGQVAAPKPPAVIPPGTPSGAPQVLPTNGGPNGGAGFQLQPNTEGLATTLQTAFDSFNTYVDRLATVAATIPSQIELTGNYVLDVQISGAAAFEALSNEMKRLAVALVEPKLNALRDEVSSATGGTVKSSASMGSRSGDSASQSSE